jgi:hypothetical protein
MTTVKEFKDLGLTPVIGDEYTFMDYKNAESFKSIMGEDDSWAGQLQTDRGIYDDEQLSMLTPLSFAWRTNTGVKPAFTGLIEVKLRSGRLVAPSEIINQGGRVVWDLDGDQCDIVEWRPLLEQQKQSAYDVDAHVSVAKGGVIPNNILGQMHEVDKRETLTPTKPVFTQEMADAGERVKVGMLFKTGAGRYTALLVSDGQVVFEHESLGFIAERHAFVHPVDLRTPKQKAVDEAVKPSDDKPVFTQEMADAGELPPVGSVAMFCCSEPEDFSVELRSGGVVKIIHHYSPLPDGCNVAVFIFKHTSGGDVSQAIPSCFKPIDTRTPKQKAVDELAKSIELSTGGSYGEIAEYLISIGYEKK